MSTGTARAPAADIVSNRISESLVYRPLIWLDAARALSALAIVWIHCPRSAELSSTTLLARFAVPFFVATAVFLIFQSVARQPERSWTSYAVSRFQRLYLPFLVWSGIYLLFKWSKSLLLPNQPNEFPGLELFVFGGAYHLWFLPFLLLVSLLTFAVAKSSLRHPATQSAWAVVGVVAGLLVAYCAPSSWLPSRFDALYFMAAALPAAFWAWPVAIWYQLRRVTQAGRAGCRESASSQALTRQTASTPTPDEAVFISSLMIAVGSSVWLLQGRSIWFENLAGTALLVSVCTPFGPRWATKARGAAELSFGIYLAHLLVVKIVEALLVKWSYPATALTDIATWAVAVVGATGIAWGLKQFRATRWLI